MLGADNDIVKNQLSLLPSQWDAVNVDYVFVFGSELLGKYIEDHNNFQRTSQLNYNAAVLKACEDLEAERLKKEVYDSPSEQEKSHEKFRQLAYETISNLRREYKPKMGTSFHEVLTELALVEYRLRKPTPYVFAIHFGEYKQCLPSSIVVKHDSIVRVPIDPAKPYAGFFKLVGQLDNSETDRPLHTTLISAFEECAKLLEDEEYRPLNELEANCNLIRSGHLVRYRESELFTKAERQITAASIRGIVDTRCREDSSITMISGRELPVEIENIDLRLGPLRSNNGNYQRFGEVKQPGPKQLVQLDQLFMERDLGKGHSILPKRILIRGPPGVGKSALSRRIMHKYTFDSKLYNQYDLVLRLPLSCLEHDDLEQALWKEYFQCHSNGQALAKELRQIILNPKRDRSATAAAELQVLFILDGLDETIGWVAEKPELLMLLNRPIVIVTSRFDSDGIKGLNNFDLELEAIGLSPENIWRYLANESIVSTEHAPKIRRFINSNSTVLGMVQIPILLDIVCYGWDELQENDEMSAQEITMTNLYKAIVQKLWRKDILTLKKKNEEGAALTWDIVRHVGDLQRLELYVQDEIDLLGEIAVTLMEKGLTVFDTNIVSKCIQQLDRRHSKKLPLELERNLPKLSLVRKLVSDQPRYTFTHSTFRDFFAARHLAQDFDRRRRLLVEQKYNREYETVWRFLAGQFSSDREKLGDFIDTLEREPRDLVGLRHVHVQMNCLAEATSGLDEIHRSSLYRSLSDWLSLELTLGSSRRYISCNMAFPEQILLDKLAKFDGDPWKLNQILEFRPVLSEKLCAALIQYASNSPGYPQQWFAVTLGLHSLLPPNIIHGLFHQFYHEDRRFFELVIYIASRNSLKEEIVSELIRKSAETDDGPSGQLSLRSDYFIEILGSQQELSPESITNLINLIESQPGEIRQSRAKILEKQPRLPPDVLKKLVDWLSRTDSLSHDSVRILAAQTALDSDLISKLHAYILEPTRQLPIDVVATLVKFPALHVCLRTRLLDWIEDLKREPTCIRYQVKDIESVVDAIKQTAPNSVDEVRVQLAQLLEHRLFQVRNRAKFWLQPELDPRRAPTMAPELLSILQRAFKVDQWTTALTLGNRLGLLVGMDPVCWLLQELAEERQGLAPNKVTQIPIHAICELLQQLPWLESQSEQVVQGVVAVLSKLDAGSHCEPELKAVLTRVAELDEKTLDDLFSLLERGNKYAAAVLQGRMQARGRLLGLLQNNKEVNEKVVTVALNALLQEDKQTFSAEVNIGLTSILAESRGHHVVLDHVAARLLRQGILPLKTIQTLEGYMATSERKKAVKKIDPLLNLDPWTRLSYHDFCRQCESLDSCILGRIFDFVISYGDLYEAFWINDGNLWHYIADGTAQKYELKDPSGFEQRVRRARNTFRSPDLARVRPSWWENYGLSAFGAGLAFVLVISWWRRAKFLKSHFN